jgi:hypothetical protein
MHGWEIDKEIWARGIGGKNMSVARPDNGTRPRAVKPLPSHSDVMMIVVVLQPTEKRFERAIEQIAGSQMANGRRQIAYGEGRIAGAL